ncbi:MAG: D-glycero-beta-D-manno-heptose-7-phosphate kinase [Pseudomonadota bacterium]|mgnify:FL=1|nr:D-glycero-beta-D-manno-heptose-7-phosphate kinase [Pseudomonadota bacterium]
MIEVAAGNVLKNLENITGKKILIVGDVGVDEYVIGDVNRISPEAPVPVVAVTEQYSRLGLSANVAQNIASLKSESVLLSITGDDETAEKLRGLLKKEKVNSDFLIKDSSRQTTRKLRVLGVLAGHHHIVRVDFEQRRFLSPEVEKKYLKRAQEVIPEVDVVIIQDYAKGVISESISQKIIELSKKNKKKVLVDPHRLTPLHFYSGANVFKPNFAEALALSKIDQDDLHFNKNIIRDVVKALETEGQFETVILTRGKEGMSFVQKGKIENVPTFAKEVFDVTGAGDTVIASLGLGLAAGFSVFESCVLANAAAGVVVGKIGCVPCYYEEAKAALKERC